MTNILSFLKPAPEKEQTITEKVSWMPNTNIGGLGCCTPEPLQLRLAKQLDRDPFFCNADHSSNHKKKYLLERVIKMAFVCSAGIFQGREKLSE